MNDKVVIAFLVSVGVFSNTLATQYVSSISYSEKKSLLSVAKSSNNTTVDKGNSAVIVKYAD